MSASNFQHLRLKTPTSVPGCSGFCFHCSLLQLVPSPFPAPAAEGQVLRAGVTAQHGPVGAKRTSSRLLGSPSKTQGRPLPLLERGLRGKQAKTLKPGGAPPASSLIQSPPAPHTQREMEKPGPLGRVGGEAVRKGVKGCGRMAGRGRTGM